MVYPNPFHNDGLSNYPYNGHLNIPPPPTPPTPLTTPATISSNLLLRRKNHFTTPTTTMDPPSPAPASLPSYPPTSLHADLPEQEWLSEFLYCCSNDYFWETCETMALVGFPAAQSDASFTSKADQKDSRTASKKSKPRTEAYGRLSSWSGKGSATHRCTHCAADDTPQWRSRPLGPKTLCNACGVRYKSGRLIPEYRPVSSPTFELSFTSKADQKDSRTAGGKSRSKTEAYGGLSSSSGKRSAMRRCTHCAADDTPQWRSGPLGPKTLCNACGVRYKSGRLILEYRPVSSPTFELSQHSNSHQKVLELQRQKDRKVLELQRPNDRKRKQQVIPE